MCSTGIAVPNPSENPWPVGDCLLLLENKGTLAGSATLNWSGHTAMTDWDGVTVRGTPQRVDGLVLESRRMTGSIPPELAGLTGLERLLPWFNRLTGEIPGELAQLNDGGDTAGDGESDQPNRPVAL